MPYQPLLGTAGRALQNLDAVPSHAPRISRGPGTADPQVAHRAAGTAVLHVHQRQWLCVVVFLL